MRIAILGTRGVPNNHGGFEQFAEYFSKYLAENGHDVYVFNSHNHPYQEKTWNGVKILHEYDPEYKIGTAGQFIYDLNCILTCRKENFDIILQLGYTSSSIWSFMFPKTSVIVTNMDGLEWKRSKYSKKTRFFLKRAELWGAKYSDFLISDSIGIQNYLQKTYNKTSEFIAYGAKVFNNPNEAILLEYNLTKHNYSMLIARMEPENNIETILDGFHNSKSATPFLVIGKINKFGSYLKEKYKTDSRIKFLGAIYNQNHLDNLRYYSRYYCHGHSVGGTNPSLLEAMASKSLIIAHDNIFNKSILNKECKYFHKAGDLQVIFDDDSYFVRKEDFCYLNIEKINTKYSWDIINKQYESYLLKTIK
ncbi:DUF1972 domain-containing protein [Algibacter pectinivorans]|uniref:Glycosyltransferase involved in cell wall bisynthesis n=1 Tax=Algibacter pectinivorans TaxID=870482 RepID=A0A1I1NMD3_9FLAO|nr:DUF1972 domain-containing protein [Algibacter pectinivorans]SFC95923.1 Glycosyltransferase involved in cell wall bisynthesis [Algibacter pectinivorans]